MSLEWRCTPFSQLSPFELYTILRLRQAVFVVEQDCVYQDLDGVDLEALHFGAWEGDALLAYVRLIPPGVTYPEPSIGRVLTAASARRTGLGQELMGRAIEALVHQHGPLPIQIGAQTYLKRFYEGFGFRVVGEGYLEDGIPHVHMLRPAV